MRKRRFLLKNDKASATLETLIAVGVSLSLLTVFYYSADSLYTVENEPGSELQAISTGVSETLINSPGQDSNGNPEWDISGDIDVLGLSTSRTIEYGTLITQLIDPKDPEAGFTAVTIDGPYSDGGSIGESKACFLSGTKIVMADESYENIEDIQIGDFVKSYDEMNGEIVDREVVDVFHHGPDEMGDHYLVINGQLRVTPNHRFFIDGEWIFASELVIGDRLFYPSTDYMVFSLEKVFERVFTYNFEVEGNHNYFVMMDPTSVLVHNGDIPQQPENPTARFTWTPNPGIKGQSIRFDASTSTGGGGAPIEFYWWDWDDGQGYQGPYTNPVKYHTYVGASTYYVTLKVKDVNGKEATKTDEVIVQNPPLSAEAWAVPSSGVEGSTVVLFSSASGGTEPYVYEWDLDGDGVVYETRAQNTPSLPLEYDPGNPTQEIFVRVKDNNGNTPYTTCFAYAEVTVYPEDYEAPIATFTWFDADGPYDQKKICFNAADSICPAGSTFTWYDDTARMQLQSGMDLTIITKPFNYETAHSVTLTIIDPYGYDADHTEEGVQANNPPDSTESESTKPWVLAGKEIWPETDMVGSGFSSYPSDYYVRYRMLEGKFKLYEVKEKTISDQPILSHEKIICLSKGSYDEKYNDIKDALGLGSDLVYNFRLEITIYNDNGSVDEQMFFGASDDTASVKESTTRQVLVYYPPTAIDEEIGGGGAQSAFAWVIDDHPMYKQAEITIYVFLGGVAPKP